MKPNPSDGLPFERGAVVKSGSEATSPMPRLAPGLRGYVVRHGKTFYCGWVEADVPGDGAMTRFLRRLSKTRVDFRFSTVVSPHLMRTLARFGWRPRVERSPEGEWESWSR